MGTADVKPSAAAELTPLLKERPSAAEAKAWCEDNLPKLPADQLYTSVHNDLGADLPPRFALEGGHGLPAQLLRGRRHLALRVSLVSCLSVFSWLV